jgi:hypothetical protein
MAYEPATDTWAKIAPPPLYAILSTAPVNTTRGLWTGDRALLSAYSQVHSYDPISDAWSSASTSSPYDAGQYLYGFAWLAGRAAVWGNGPENGYCGAIFAPDSGSWAGVKPSEYAGCPSDPLVLALGTRLLVWGGVAPDGGTMPGRGAIFDPGGAGWTNVTSVGAPSARRWAIGAWTGTEVVVWGGWSGADEGLSDGAIYDPAKDQWRPMAPNDAIRGASPRLSAWADGRLLVYQDETKEPPRGAIYDLASDAWRPMSGVGMPHMGRGTAVWTGAELVLWGGISNGGRGWIYRPPKKK